MQKYIYNFLLRGTFFTFLFLGTFTFSNAIQAAEPELDWSKRLGGAGTSGYGIASDSTGNVFVVGEVRTADLNDDGDFDDPLESFYGNDDGFITAYDSEGNVLWYKRFGGSGQDHANDVAVGPSDEVVVVGHIDGNADLNGDGDTGDIQETSSSPYGAQDIFISVFDNSGTNLWYKRLGGALFGDSAYGVDIDSSGNIAIVGVMAETADLNGDGDTSDPQETHALINASEDAFITVFDSSGISLWFKRLGGELNSEGGTAQDAGLNVAFDNTGNVAITGYVNGTSDLNGDGDLVDVQEPYSLPYGGQDVFISVFDALSGANVWYKRMGGQFQDKGADLLFDSLGNVLLVADITGSGDFNGDGDTGDLGETQIPPYGSQDILLAKMDDMGASLWHKRLGGALNDGGAVYGDGSDIAIDSSDNILVATRIYGTGDLNGDGDELDAFEVSASPYGMGDMIIAGFNASGTNIWYKRLGGTSEDAGRSIALDSSDNVLVTGRFGGPADMNGDGDTSDTKESLAYNIPILKYIFSSDTVSPVISLSSSSVTNNSLELTGTATDADNTVASVEYQIDSTSGSWTACTADDGTFDEAAEDFTCTATSLDEGSHTVYVRATDSEGNVTSAGSYSENTFSIEEEDEESEDTSDESESEDLDKPDINEIDEVDEDSVRLDIDTNVDNTELTFKIRVRNEDDDNTEYEEFTRTTDNEGDVRITIEDLEGGTDYSFKVAAKEAGGEYTDYSDEKEITTRMSIDNKGSQPTSLEVVFEDDVISLSWEDNAEVENGYLIERKIGEGQFEQIASIDENNDTYQDSNVTPNVQYTYRVRAYKGNDYTDYSNEATIFTSAFVNTAEEDAFQQGNQDNDSAERNANNEQSSDDSDDALDKSSRFEDDDVDITDQSQEREGVLGVIQPLDPTTAATVKTVGVASGAAAAAGTAMIPFLSIIPRAFRPTGLSMLQNVRQGLGSIGRNLIFAPFLITTSTFQYPTVQTSLLTGVFGRKRKRDWGVVFDSDTKSPVSGAVVSLVNDKGKVVDTTTSDEQGRYGFLANPGRYTLRITKGKYTLDRQREQDSLYGELYNGQTLQIANPNQMILMNIALDPGGFDWMAYAQRTLKKYYSFAAIFFKYLLLALYGLGLLYSLFVAFVQPNILNIALALVYLFFLAMLIKKRKHFGQLLHHKTRKPIPFAQVELFKNQERVRFAVTDTLGRYYILAPKGTYELRVQGRTLSGETFSKITSTTISRGVLREDIVV